MTYVATGFYEESVVRVGAKLTASALIVGTAIMMVAVPIGALMSLLFSDDLAG